MSLHMWCTSCQQDVPAVATPDDDKVRCTRCKQEILPRSSDEPRAKRPTKPAASPKPPQENRPAIAGSIKAGVKPSVKPQDSSVPPWAFVERAPVNLEAWRWDQDLLEAERLLQTYRRPIAQSTRLESVVGRSKKVTKKPAAREFVRRSPAVAAFTWTLMSLGVMAAVFGGVLLGWSVWTDQRVFWTIGLPFALGGQAGLVLGLILQLDVLWHSSGQTASVLEELDEHIDELRQVSELIETQRSDGPHAFYSQIAGTGLRSGTARAA